MASAKPETVNLPDPVILRGVPYGVYVRLRDDERNDQVRMTYHDGVLELMSPEFIHERGAHHLSMIVNGYAAVLGVDCEGARTTTFRKGVPKQLKGKGKGPDASFYFANAPAVRGKDRLDLTTDPPPDLWIEVDYRASSAGKLPLYAELGVVELWRYRPQRGVLWIGRLQAGAHVEVPVSGCLPGMTPRLLLDLLNQAAKRGESFWDAWMRGWIAANADYFAGRKADYTPF
jgi:Uma2 family endonuclease